MALPALPFFVAIGASGSEGLGDIKALLRLLPKSLAAIVLVVLHRPSDKGMQQNAIDYDGPISFIGSAGEIADAIGSVVAAMG
jgi:streptogramin lyase